MSFHHYIRVIRELAWADFKLKYYGSVFGLLWSFLKPFLMLTILYVVFFVFLRVDVEHYAWYLLLGIIFWNFFADATKDAMQSIQAKAHVIQNTKLPPSAVVVSSLLHSFLTFAISLLAFFVLLLIFGPAIQPTILLLLCSVLLLALFTAGTIFFTIPLSVYFKDFTHIWDIFLQMFFWITPIVYQHFLVPTELAKWYLLNPLARIIIEARTAAIYGILPEAKQMGITLALVLIVLGIGAFMFKKSGRHIQERI